MMDDDQAKKRSIEPQQVLDRFSISGVVELMSLEMGRLKTRRWLCNFRIAERAGTPIIWMD